SAECFGFARWAILEHRNGPLYGIEITLSFGSKSLPMSQKQRPTGILVYAENDSQYLNQDWLSTL
ncbi:MAG TPA: hypothetical protein VMU41_10245, partial [Candidatus Binataceae bacterium]|nr:hypothetical protein [Candidatus Binataceae bacterium]